MSNHSKRLTLMKCNTMKTPKQLRKAKSFYSKSDTLQLSNQVDGTDEKLKKLEQSFHNQSDFKILQSQPRFNKTFLVNKKNNFCSTIIPDWLKQRKDFQQICYTESINDLMSVPKIILKQQRNAIEDQKIKDWIQNKVYGLPDELYKDIIQIMMIRVFTYEEIFDVDHNITLLYEGKISRVNKDYGFPINGTSIKVGDFLSDEYLYIAKMDVIIVDLPKIELMQLMDGFKIQKQEQFVKQMKQFPAFKSIKKHSLQKIITRGQLQLIIKNYQRFQRASNSEYLNILFYGNLQLNLRKLISKMNKWPIGQNQWQTKTYYQYQDRILELESLNCFGLTDDQYTISTKDSCVLLQIRRNILETILTTEQINDLKQSIDIFKQESKGQWRERMRRKFDQEIIQQKTRMEKMMIALYRNYNYGQDQLLGNGKYGKIVIAKHQLVNEQVLMKILEKKNLKLNRDLQNLENEIQILRQVKHQNIIQLFEILESTYNIYMIFEFGEGDDLKHKLNQCQKLENIVLQNGKPKIIDFSQAIKIDQQSNKDYTTIKLSYQSPEMLNSLYYEFDGQKYDMWCLGLILYQLLQGQMPFDNITNNNDLKNKIKKSQFQINLPISQQVCSLLEAMLNVDPNKRISLNDLINFLEQQNLIFEDEYLKVPDDIPIHLIIKELEDNQIETVNLFQQLEQNKHCTLTTCYYLIKNKLMKRAKLNKIKANLISFENSKFNFMTKLRNSLQFTTTKSRIYQNGTRVHTENNPNRAETTSQHSYKQRSLSKTNNNKTPFMKQIQQASKLSQTQNSFFPSYNSTYQNQNILNKNNNNKSNNINNNNQNFQQLGIISDGYQIYQDKLQQRLKNLLYSNNNYIIQVTNTKRRSVSQKN